MGLITHIGVKLCTEDCTTFYDLLHDSEQDSFDCPNTARSFHLPSRFLINYRLCHSGIDAIRSSVNSRNGGNNNAINGRFGYD
jgi:hypothetical protein